MSEENTMSNNYGHAFYKDRHQKTIHSARTVLAIILAALPEVNSAVEFGCGVGTWLSVLKEEGVGEIQGMDGPWVEQDLLEIPIDNFRQVNFESGVKLDRKYDLAISLEVAEHLSDRAAAQFVDSLTNAADFVLFSAAIPFQGGIGHINEQWPDYWAKLFNDRGYVALDFVRGQIWHDRQIPVWYRQNILLFVKKEQLPRVKLPQGDAANSHLPMSLVHPDIYVEMIMNPSVKKSWRIFQRAVGNWVNRKLSKIS
jgi:hypothetical protein